ncbi:hypothetical protein [Natranaerobius thermophilus]|uniref:SpoOB alpha-helical domain-containing protein n=1 Tax=Natranaerobius thermophilus (strain ATCC BAA-1301 / DSM 18059 / JW/NM-WN-LF) TaxID=457570 RepID=B2A6B6_NATTJ|nr:hypothetical protein [Natranaerobius thermophilus]ACB84127.1 hypothetical protein Nther_0531 [Natranaerobius thermophilus JW/NM-WN-LF]
MDQKGFQQGICGVIIGIVVTFLIPLMADLITPYLLFLTPVVIIYWLIVYKYLKKQYHQELNKRVSEIKERNYQQLTNDIRRIRHDIVNHFQIVYSLAQLSGEQRLIKHLKKIKFLDVLYGEILKLPQYDLTAFYLNQFVKTLDSGGQFYFRNTANINEFDLGKTTAELLQNICDEINLFKNTDTSLKINWELREDEDCYIIVLDVYDSQRTWKTIDENFFIALQDKFDELKFNFEYFTFKTQIWIKLCIYKNTDKSSLQ